MTRASTIKRLPEEIRELIGALRDQGRTIDEILAKLHELNAKVSRSSLGRHVKQLDAIGEEIRRSRTIAEALVQKYGDAPESRTARLNIELMHAVLMKLIISEEGEIVHLDPKESMFIATSLQKLAQASKQDLDREAVLRKEFAKKLDEATQAAQAAGEKGLSADRLAELRREFLGVGKGGGE
jgi:hypothetical protein